MKLLIVCVGNICRSPMAVAALRRGLPENFDIASAGLAARVGDGVHPTAAEVMNAKGYDIAEHIARQFTPAMIEDTHCILTMERRHAQALMAIAPRAQGRLHLLGRWEKPHEIRDPCGQPKAAFEAAFDAIEHHAQLWCARLM